MSVWSLLILIGTQLLFTASDLMGRHFMKTQGFTAASFASWWFLGYMTVRTVATFGQLWIFTLNDLGRTMAVFAAASIILSNVLGLLLLKEALSLTGYIGVTLAVITVLVLMFK